MTDFMIAISKNESYSLYDVFNFCKYRGGILNVTSAGEWTSETRLHIRIPKDPIIRRSNMHGMTLLMAGLVKICFKKLKN